MLTDRMIQDNKQLFLFIFFLLLNSIAHAQLNYVPDYIPPQAEPTTQPLNQARTMEGEPLQLPFWDDFSNSYNLVDTAKWVDNGQILISDSYGVLPPTINVAVMDGINISGQPYSNKISDKGLGDEMISRSIDLEAVPEAERSSVYLSFYYQPQGLGDKPEIEDSIRVQFKASNDRWHTIWSKKGDMLKVTEFRQIKPIQIRDLIGFGDSITFFHANFQLRFQVFGNTSFSYDTWLLDYIYLDKGRTAADTTYFDRALYSRPTSLFKDYYSVPIHHLMQYGDQLTENISFGYKNLSNEPNQSHAYWITVDLKDQTTYTNLDTVNSEIGINQPNLPQELERRDLTGGKFDYTSLAPYIGSRDTFKLRTLTYIDTEDATNIGRNLKQNDTIRNFHTISDFYAYDDGSAEFAMGIDKKNGRVAYKYVLPEPDTITGIDIYLPNYFNNSNALSMRFFVLSSLENNPQSVLFSQIFPLGHTAGLNEFQRFNFSGFAVVEDTFYIGYQQQIDNYVAIGLDANTDSHENLFFSVDASGNWEKNFQVKKGSMMMRPVLGPATITSSKKPVTDQTSIIIYPNPGKGRFMVDSRSPILNIEVLNLQGQRININHQNNVVEFNSPPGIYIFRISTSKGTTQKKVMLQP